MEAYLQSILVFWIVITILLKYFESQIPCQTVLLFLMNLRKKHDKSGIKVRQKCGKCFIKCFLWKYSLTYCLKCICMLSFVYKKLGQKLGNFWLKWFCWVILIKNVFFSRHCSTSTSATWGVLSIEFFLRNNLKSIHATFANFLKNIKNLVVNVVELSLVFNSGDLNQY